MSSPPTAKRREKRATQTKNIVDEFNLLDQHVLQFEDNNQRKRKASLVSSKHSLLKYTTYEHVRQHVDFFFRIKDAALNREFYEFSSMKKSGGFLMLMSMMISFLMFPMHVMIFCEDLKETDNQNYTYRCVTSFLSLLGK